MNEVINELKADIANAAKIVIGIGKEFEFDYGDNSDLSGYIMAKNIENDSDNVITAYKKLFELVNGKDYYIISLSMDDRIYNVFDKERVVTPCGTTSLFQCKNNCNNLLLETNDEILNYINSFGKEAENVANIPTCKDCGAALVANNIVSGSYNEAGYLDKFADYKKWLQSTVNKELVLVELGVGMRFPTVIRLPFDKMCLYNNKCKFYRVHESLYQHTVENKEKGISVKSSAVKFLLEI